MKFKTVSVTLKFFFLLLTTILYVSCQNEKSPDSLLATIKENESNNVMTSYEYTTHWDNRFNKSEFRDTSSITIERSQENIHGFVFSASGQNYGQYFDGVDGKMIDHQNRQVIAEDRKVLATDSTAYTYNMSFMATPGHFKDIDSTYQYSDSLIDGRQVGVFTSIDSEDSDSVKVISVSAYVVDRQTAKPLMVINTSIKATDTLQVITHYFQEVVYSNNSIDFDKIKATTLELGYPEISSNQAMEDMASKQLKIGSKAVEKTYQDVNGKQVNIYGRSGRKSVIMFSFIGCGGCEYAMKEMKNKNYQFRDNIDFYYSSPQDKSKVLKEYLLRKDFNGIGFGKESNMNEEFQAFSFPTFFILDVDGKVTQRYSGYTEDVEKEIF